MNTYKDAALILWNPDVIELVSLALLHRNLKSKGIEPDEGIERMEDLIHSTRPTAVIFDLEPPYDRSASIAHHLMDRFPDCSFVITCADSKHVRRTAPWLSAYPMFQKPYRVEDIADKIHSIVTGPIRNVAFEAGFFREVRRQRRVETEARVFNPTLGSAALTTDIRRRLLN